MFKMEAIGIKDAQKYLADRKKELDAELKKAFRQVGTLVRDDAKALTPVDTGALQKSIKFSATKTKVRVYSKLPYAAAVHWGRKRKGKGGGKSKNTRFIYDAIIANRDKIRTILQEATSKAAGGK